MQNMLIFFFLILSNAYIQAAACANGEQNAWQVCLNEVTYPSSVAKEVYKRMKDAALEHGRKKNEPNMNTCDWMCARTFLSH